ncbi:anthranilate synthase component II [Aliidiomarina taiwanensis]|uniref:anthranilate synthase n=1 Tax=Aliidiomarina taiwanensis TaxID=946228 RepID=A0A432X1Q2_9GAMM|nr:aminodeoxychorismate/anthranilate synthase component II [Aliidiomarina taiwanensis]RUO40537.1 anthranilate synthase component II [Aliidiomarina taiwanensis]
MKPTLPPHTQGVVFVLDNLDSFTYNLVDEFAQLGFYTQVFRNTLPLASLLAHLTELEQVAADHGLGPVTLVLSPGPGYPAQAGQLIPLIKACVGRVPMVGICLGFQALVEHFGGHIGPCSNPAHGKSAAIQTQAHPLYQQLPQPLLVARYHSLQATQVPSELEIIAQLDTIPMAICHKQHAILGLQFHPESIMTTTGSQLLSNCIQFLENQYA